MRLAAIMASVAVFLFIGASWLALDNYLGTRYHQHTGAVPAWQQQASAHGAARGPFTKPRVFLPTETTPQPCFPFPIPMPGC